MTNPFLLSLDEATEGLAPLVREDIWRCLKTLRDVVEQVGGDHLTMVPVTMHEGAASSG